MGIPNAWREPLAIVAGVRTPFAKAYGTLSGVNADQLGLVVARGALERAKVSPDQIDETVFGSVSGQIDAANVSRVIALRAGVPRDRIAHTVNRNCASGMEAVITAGQILHEGRANVILAGGTESMSNIPLIYQRETGQWFRELSRAKSAWERMKLISRIRPKMFQPIVGIELGLTDPTCGLNMGQTAENVAREFGVSRQEQDEFALTSHERAIAAWQRGYFAGEVVPISADITRGAAVDRDSGPRPGQSMESLAKLRPFFDKNGTVTVGNSCPITDGAAAAVVMFASEAQRRGLQPLGYVRNYAVAGLDPSRMGLGPVFATHKLLSRTGMNLQNFDLVEINEAFAAQVLGCVKAMASREFCQRELGRNEAIGELDRQKLNVNGGAIALGHPVGASGMRLILTLLQGLRATGGRRGLATLCVGGGQGAALLLETELSD